jgi:Tfp pilus assembly protein PilN
MKLDVRIDFIARRRKPVLGLCLAVLALAALGWQGTLALREADLLQSQRDGLASLQRQASGASRPTMSADDVKRHAQIDALARYLATPWPQLLALFEEHAASRVTLLKFEPDAAEGRIEVTGRAPGSKALARYLVELERDPRLSGVMLHQHEVLRAEAGAPVEFTFGAVWVAASRAGAVAPVAAAASAPLREAAR